MHTFDKQAAQGDILLNKIDALPADVVAGDASDGTYTLSHSETGHKHAVAATDNVKFYRHANDNMRCYLVVENEPQELKHYKTGKDAHESYMLAPGVYEVIRQREYSPEGWRVAID